MDGQRKKTAKLVAGLLVIFIAGMVLGAVATTLFIESRIEDTLKKGPHAMRKMALARMSKALKLDADQEAAIAPIMRDTQQQLLRLRLANQPELERILQEGMVRIKAELREDQRETLDRIYQESYARWHIKPEDVDAAPTPLSGSSR